MNAYWVIQYTRSVFCTSPRKVEELTDEQIDRIVNIVEDLLARPEPSSPASESIELSKSAVANVRKVSASAVEAGSLSERRALATAAWLNSQAEARNSAHAARLA